MGGVRANVEHDFGGAHAHATVSRRSPEARLVVALFARAILTNACPVSAEAQKHSWQEEPAPHWCQMVGLDPAYVREMAMRWKTAKQGDQHA